MTRPGSLIKKNPLISHFESIFDLNSALPYLIYLLLYMRMLFGSHSTDFYPKNRHWSIEYLKKIARQN